MKSSSVLITTTEDRISELKECLDALKFQSVYPNEIIVIVDGVVEDKSIYNIQMKNLYFHFNDKALGSNASRNIAISLSSMDLLFFCDDDDFFSYDKVELTGRFFEDNPLIDAVYGRSLIFLEDTNLKYYSSPEVISSLNNPLVKNVFGATSNYVVNSSFLKKVKVNYDEKMPALQDWDFMLRLYLCGARIVPLKSALTHYRVKLNSKSISKSIDKHCEAVKLFESKYCAELKMLSKKELLLRADNEVFTKINKLMVSDNKIMALVMSINWSLKRFNLKFIFLSLVSLFGYRVLFYIKMKLSK